MPETERTDHLDDVFDELARDVARTSTPRGAAGAVRAARRRRRALVGAVAAAVLAAGGVVVGLALGGASDDNAIDPAGSGDAAAMPEPAALDAAGLTEATRGWTRAWSHGIAREAFDRSGSGDQAESACPDEGSQGGETSRGLGFVPDTFRVDSTQGLVRTFIPYPSPQDARADYESITTAAADCVGAVTTAFTDAEVSTFRVPNDTRPDTTLVVAIAGSRVGLLDIEGVAKAPSPATTDRLAEVLVAGLTDGDLAEQAEQMMSGGGSVSVGESEPAAPRGR